MTLDEPLVLDTHAWLWYVAKDPRIGPRFAAIDQAGQKKRLSISAISFCEIAMLEAKGRIQLDGDCLEWLRRHLAASQVATIPFSPEIAVDAVHLPGEF